MLNFLKMKKTVAELNRDYFVDLTALRENREDLLKERQAVENALLPKASAMKAVDEWLDDIEEQGELKVSGFAIGSPGDWPMMRGQIGVMWLAALLVGINRKAIREHVAALVDEYYLPRVSCTAAEKAARLAEIDGRLLELEIVEERLVRQGEAIGLSVLRREDADPAVVIARYEDLAA
jgi:hypothetical protein